MPVQGEEDDVHPLASAALGRHLGLDLVKFLEDEVADAERALAVAELLAIDGAVPRKEVVEVRHRWSTFPMLE